MAKRSITDVEIGLIKAMLGRKMKNSDIQLYFNRPDRKVNSGRITGIGNGSYSNSKTIAAASTADLDAFLSDAASSVSAQPDDPLSETRIRAHFSEGMEFGVSAGAKLTSASVRQILASSTKTSGFGQSQHLPITRAEFCSLESSTRTRKARLGRIGATQLADWTQLNSLTLIQRTSQLE